MNTTPAMRKRIGVVDDYGLTQDATLWEIIRW